LNERHQLVIVGSALDADTERIVDYLADEHDVAINAVFFRVFRDGDREYLTRAWLREPGLVEAIPSHSATGAQTSPKGRVPWNGECYVGMGDYRAMRWTDAMKYGFIAACGGARYSTPLLSLDPGDRVWVYSPGAGYVGVGVVRERRVKADQFMVTTPDGKTVPILEAEIDSPEMARDIDDADKAVYMVRVEWLAKRGVKEAINEKGFFSNPAIVARPHDARWPYTIDRLKQGFNLGQLPPPPQGGSNGLASVAGQTTRVGFVNRNGQEVVADTGLAGTDHNARAYELKCGECGNRYHANGTDIHGRLCPGCQGGAPGVAIGES
jgi:hypothetical protein